MASFAGKDGRVRLASIAADADGDRIDIGPSGSPDLGQVERWRLNVQRDQLGAAAMGDEFRAFDAGLTEWSAEIRLLWDAATATVYQDELWEAILEDDFTGSFAQNGAIELTFAVDGETAGDKKAYYGLAALRTARVLTGRGGLARLQTEWAGASPLRYASALFADGSFGALSGYSCEGLAVYSFADLESLAEA